MILQNLDQAAVDVPNENRSIGRPCRHVTAVNVQGDPREVTGDLIIIVAEWVEDFIDAQIDDLDCVVADASREVIAIWRNDVKLAGCRNQWMTRHYTNLSINQARWLFPAARSRSRATPSFSCPKIWSSCRSGRWWWSTPSRRWSPGRCNWIRRTSSRCTLCCADPTPSTCDHDCQLRSFAIRRQTSQPSPCHCALLAYAAR